MSRLTKRAEPTNPKLRWRRIIAVGPPIGQAAPAPVPGKDSEPLATGWRW
jgi:hypothetical protein